MKENMFCFQCQETAKGTGCTVKGVCGKMSSTSAMMDMLLFSVRGIAIVANTLRNGHRKIDEKSTGLLSTHYLPQLPMPISTISVLSGSYAKAWNSGTN